MYTTRISINTQFLLFIGKLQGGPNSYPLLVHLVYREITVNMLFCLSILTFTLSQNNWKFVTSTAGNH